MACNYSLIVIIKTSDSSFWAWMLNDEEVLENVLSRMQTK